MLIVQSSISIHTLRVEGDKSFVFLVKKVREFQSTPSVWRVTIYITVILVFNVISIHTLRVEGDG